MPKIGDIARVSEDKNLTRETSNREHGMVTIQLVQTYIDQNPGETNSQLARYFFPQHDWDKAQAIMATKLKAWVDKGKLVRRRYNGKFHYYPFNFKVPGDPTLPGDVSKSYLCKEPGCTKRFSSMQARGAHMRSHRADRPTSTELITEYIREHRPATYSEIEKGLELPKGTVASVLSRIRIQGILGYKDNRYYIVGPAVEQTEGGEQHLNWLDERIWAFLRDGEYDDPAYTLLAMRAFGKFVRGDNSDVQRGRTTGAPEVPLESQEPDGATGRDTY